LLYIISHTYLTNYWQFSCFKKTSTSDGGETSVTLFHCIHSPIDAILKGCACSARACFISWNKAYCLFPSATILKRTSYRMTPLTQTDYPRTIAAIKRDSEEGLIVKTGEWMIKTLNDEVSKTHPEFAFARSVSDKLSWVIKLDTTDVSPATTPDSLLDDARFSVEVTSQSSIVSHLKLRYDVLASCALQHTYICLSRYHFEPAVEWGERRRRQYEEQIRQLEQVLHAETSMQLTMLDPDDRPPQYATIISRRGKDHTAKGHFKAPPNWNYFDAEIQAELRRITEQLLATGPPK